MRFETCKPRKGLVAANNQGRNFPPTHFGESGPYPLKLDPT